jgi:hypothetical protein
MHGQTQNYDTFLLLHSVFTSHQSSCLFNVTIHHAYPLEVPPGTIVGVLSHLPSHRRAPHPRIIHMLVIMPLQLSHGALPIFIRSYLCSYSLRNYAKTGSTPRIPIRILTFLPNDASPPSISSPFNPLDPLIINIKLCIIEILSSR